MATELKDYESHYDRLEVHPECTKTEIRFGINGNLFSTTCIKINAILTLIQIYVYSLREAWLRLSMQYHPDLNPDDEKAAQKFMEIKESYKG